MKSAFVALALDADLIMISDSEQEMMESHPQKSDVGTGLFSHRTRLRSESI